MYILSLLRIVRNGDSSVPGLCLCLPKKTVTVIVVHIRSRQTIAPHLDGQHCLALEHWAEIAMVPWRRAIGQIFGPMRLSSVVISVCLLYLPVNCVTRWSGRWWIDIPSGLVSPNSRMVDSWPHWTPRIVTYSLINVSERRILRTYQLRTWIGCPQTILSHLNFGWMLSWGSTKEDMYSSNSVPN